MLSTAADALQLAQAAPWLAVGVLALVAAAWVYRQTRRNIAALEAKMLASNERQGKRLGAVEQTAGLLDLRRRQVEWALTEDGLPLPYWPPDGKTSGRGPARVAGRPQDFRRDVDEDLADVDELGPETQQRRIPVPPLDPAVAARHRRD